MFMRPLMLALICATVMSAVPASGGAQTPPRMLRPIGSGAQFVVPNAALYLALHRDPAGEQAHLLDRFTSIYAAAREIEGVQSMASSALGLSFDEVIQGIDSWVGGEVFVAASTYDDFSAVTSAGSSIDLDCSVPGFLVGASIGDVAAFQRFMLTATSRLEAGGLRTATENRNGVDIFFAGRSPEPGGGVYMAIHRGYVLISPSRDRLIEALDREPQASLASSSTFQSALARFPEQQLAFLYTAGNQPSPFGGRSPVAWQAGALRLTPDSVRLDVAQSLIPDALGPATRALLEKAPNPLRAAGAAPAGTALFIGWDNVRLLWNQIVEVFWPNPDQYARIRADFAQSSGLDLEDDLFGWMTGEAGIFITPAADQQGAIMGIGFGLLVEAKDRAVGRQKLDKIMDAIRRAALPSAQATTETVDDASFTRVPVDADTAFYGGLVDQWVVVTTARSVAAGTVGATKGRGSLASQPEYGFVRSRLAERQQFLFFAAPPSLAEMFTSAARASGGQVEDLTPYVRPIPGVGLGVDFTVNFVDTRYVAHVVVPDQPIALPRPATPARPTQGFRTPLFVLVDASKHGGAWWADDEEPSPVTVPRRAQALEQFAARNRIFLRPIAISPEQRVGRQARGSFDSDVIQPREQLILRVGSEGAYLPEEIDAYQSFVRCGGTVVLLSDAKEPGTTDELAAAFGMDVAGQAAVAPASPGNAGPEPMLDAYVEHPVTSGVTLLPMGGGTGLVDWDDWTLPLGFLSEDSYLDLDGNGLRDADEPFAAPALAIRPYGRGTVVFLGTTNILDQPEHPLFGQLLRYLSLDTTAGSRRERDDPSLGRDESVDGGAQLLDFEWLLE